MAAVLREYLTSPHLQVLNLGDDLVGLSAAMGRDSIGAVMVSGVGVGMDPVTLVVTALAAGAALGLEDVSAAAVRGAYVSLKALTARRLTCHEEASRAWEAPLVAELAAAGNTSFVAASHALRCLIDEAGSSARSAQSRGQVHKASKSGTAIPRVSSSALRQVAESRVR
jgi:hypothetical protein